MKGLVAKYVLYLFLIWLPVMGVAFVVVSIISGEPHAWLAMILAAPFALLPFAGLFALVDLIRKSGPRSRQLGVFEKGLWRWPR